MRMPEKVTDGDATAGAGAEVFARLLPPMSEVPEAFLQHSNPWRKVVAQWFFEGLPKGSLRAQEGVDETDALRHVAAALRSLIPSHGHKCAGVAYLLSLWFLPPSETP